MNLSLMLFSTVLFQQGLSVRNSIQLGFAHRVINKIDIEGTLASGVIAFEIDICFEKELQKWYVSHVDGGCCSCNASELAEWFAELKRVLGLKKEGENGYRYKMAAIWLDIKSRIPELEQVPDIIHDAELPHHLEIFYDLLWFTETSRNVFDLIRNKLNANEGIMFYGGESKAKEIYKFFCQKGFTKGIFNTVPFDSLSVGDLYKCPNDPGGCGFKAVYAWTISSQDKMETLINPYGKYRADGVIYGGSHTWDPVKDAATVDKFSKAVERFFPSLSLPLVATDFVLRDRPLASMELCDGQLAGYTSFGETAQDRNTAYGSCWDTPDCAGITRKPGPLDLWTLRAGTECLPSEMGESSYLLGKRCPNHEIGEYTTCALGRQNVTRCVAYQQCLDCLQCDGITQSATGDWTLRKGTCVPSSSGETSVQIRGF